MRVFLYSCQYNHSVANTISYENKKGTFEKCELTRNKGK